MTRLFHLLSLVSLGLAASAQAAGPERFRAGQLGVHEHQAHDGIVVVTDAKLTRQMGWSDLQSAMAQGFGDKVNVGLELRDPNRTFAGAASIPVVLRGTKITFTGTSAPLSEEKTVAGTAKLVEGHEGAPVYRMENLELTALDRDPRTGGSLGINPHSLAVKVGDHVDVKLGEIPQFIK